MSVSKKPYRRMRGNGQGTAYKRGRTWTASVTIGWHDGKPIKRTKGGFPTKRQALEHCAVLFRRPEQKEYSLLHYWEIWSESALVKLSKSKQTAYRIAWRKLADVHGVPPGRLTVGDLQDILRSKAPTFYPARDIKSLLAALYRLAIADQCASVDLSKYLVLPELEEGEPNPFREDELTLIWHAYASGDRVAAYVLLMIYTGMMPGELCICTRKMIDLDSQQIVGAGIKTKTRKQQPMVIADFLLPVVCSILSSTPCEDDARILYTDRWTFYDDYHAFCRRIGIRDLPMYSCRHTTATALAVGANVAPSIIQKIMRHAKFSTTQRYIHPDSSDALAGINLLKAPNPQKS